MRADIVTLCHSVLEQNNKLSILGAFDRVVVPSLPYKYQPPWALAVRVSFVPEEAGERELKFTVADTDGRILAQAKADLRIPPGSFHLPVTVNIAFPILGMELQCDGEYVIDLILDGAPPLRTPFYVAREAGQSPA